MAEDNAEDRVAIGNAKKAAAAKSKLVEYLRKLDDVGGPKVQASQVASYLWSINREWRPTQGGGNCLFWAFLSASLPPGCKPTKATMMSLRKRIAKHASDVSLQAVMAKGRGLWQRSSTCRGSSANDRPKQPAEYPKFTKRAGEWGNQFDMALLAWELASQQALAGVTTPHRRLISVDRRPGLLNT